ncbi:hypothetical protein LTR36_009210 [Oleoguttula mirabilis]|uniref:F-box domain-containing protein n=1 Tax=Oleoguttula mirabilis TaxID=1507867 RepID=A0AAV9J719_9PEZI|nr:hypothetical protein LTR36_009210 [Oleoguttula mirabilis]
MATLQSPGLASSKLTTSAHVILQQVAKLRQAQQLVTQPTRDRNRISHPSPEVQQTMGVAEACLTELERLVCNLVPSVEVDSFDENRRRLTEKVFGIPELLEHICLSGLSVRDLLQMQQVNKTCLSSILSSPKLLRFMALIAEPSASYSSAFAIDNVKCSGFRSFRTSLVEHADSSVSTINDRERRAFVELKATLCSPSEALPTLGPRPRTMLLYQPPIYEMTATADCCRARSTIRSATGITVGDLYEAVVAFKASHRLCPFAAIYKHDEAGNVKVGVRFSGEVPLCESEKTLLRSRRLKDACPLEYVARSPDSDFTDSSDDSEDYGDGDSRVSEPRARKRMRHYARAKLAAHNIRQAIPTFAEYLDAKKSKPKRSGGQERKVKDTAESDPAAGHATSPKTRQPGA